MLIKTLANGLTRLRMGGLHFTKHVLMRQRSDTTVSKRLTEKWCEGFLKQFLSHVALGRFGPNCKLFLVPFSVLLEYELYTLICLCENTFILLSFEVWVTKIIHVMNVVLCIFYVLQHLST